MNTELLSVDMVWWITVIDIPAMATLFWLIWRTRYENSRLCHEIEASLNDFKLDVARHYASRADVQMLEKRLVSHLLRIEAKLDSTALKAEAAQILLKDE